jgi:hypothetical protein
MPGQGHAANDRTPGEVAALIAAFLATLPEPSEEVPP